MPMERSNQRQFSFLLNQVFSSRTLVSHFFLSLRIFLSSTVPKFVKVCLHPGCSFCPCFSTCAISCFYVPLPKVTVKKTPLPMKLRFLSRFRTVLWQRQRCVPMLWVHKWLVFQLSAALKQFVGLFTKQGNNFSTNLDML